MMQRSKNILVFTTWSFKDGLIQAATLPYLKIISRTINGNIYLLCLEQPGMELTPREYHAAQAVLAKDRIQLIRFNYHKNKLRALTDWAFRFIYLIAFIYLKRISYFHPLCSPAAGLAWVLSKFKKVTLVVDSFEPHAEVMEETGVWNREGRLFKIFFSLERKIVLRADRLLAVSKGIPFYIRERYQLAPPLEKISYRPLCVDPALFSRTPPDYSLIGWSSKGKRIVAIYTGKIGGMYYDKELCTFIKACIRFWTADFHLIICTAMDKNSVTELFGSQGIPAHFYTVTFVDHRKVPRYLSLADFGISFSRPSAARQYGCPTKNAEYWAMGLPIIATAAIRDDNENIANNPYLGVLMPDTVTEDMDDTLQKLEQLLNRKDSIAPLIRQFAVRERAFDTVRYVYEAVYAEKIQSL